MGQFHDHLGLGLLVLEINSRRSLMLQKFKEHPASVNESYFQHMGVALAFSGRFCVGAFAALVHAFFPFLFEKTGSRLISAMHTKMVTSRAPQTLD